MTRDVGPGAITVFHQVVKSDPRFAPGFNNLGVALKAQGRLGHGGAHCTGTPCRSIPGWPPPISTSAKSGPVRETSTRRSTTTGRPCGSIPISPWPTTSSVVALLAKGRRDEVDDCYPESVKPLDRASVVKPWTRRSRLLLASRPL